MSLVLRKVVGINWQLERVRHLDMRDILIVEMDKYTQCHKEINLTVGVGRENVLY